MVESATGRKTSNRALMAEEYEIPDSSPLAWRYTTQGKRRHLVDSVHRAAGAACGLSHWSHDFWLGSGSQEEYEIVAHLPNCKSCVRAATGPPVTKRDLDRVRRGLS